MNLTIQYEQKQNLSTIGLLKMNSKTKDFYENSEPIATNVEEAMSNGEYYYTSNYV